MKTFLMGIAGLAVLVLVALIGMQAISSMSRETPSVTNAAISTTTIAEETPNYAIHIDYPQFGLPEIDAQIRSDIGDAVTEFKALPANPPDSAASQNTFDGTFDSLYIGPDVVGVKLLLSQYTGGAHEMPVLNGVNFDRATGKKLLLADVLPMIGKTTAEVSEEATTEFKAKFGNNFFSKGADTNPENFSSFVISKDKVTFIFQPYQVAAYSAGPQEVSFTRIK